MTICPHCKNGIPSVRIQPLKGYIGTTAWNVVSYNCPTCHASLSMQIDPIAIKTDTVNELKRR